MDRTITMAISSAMIFFIVVFTSLKYA